jgi:hypothetical protein
MNVENYITPSTITTKMVMLLAIISTDVFLNTTVIYADVYSEQGLGGENTIQGGSGKEPYVFLLIASAIQMICQLCLLFWYFFLVWRTFLFRFGLLY